MYLGSFGKYLYKAEFKVSLTVSVASPVPEAVTFTSWFISLIFKICTNIQGLVEKNKD